MPIIIPPMTGGFGPVTRVRAGSWASPRRRYREALNRLNGALAEGHDVRSRIINRRGQP
jgi:hypothetical protein